MLTEECLLSRHKYRFWLRGNLHLHNKCYMKSRAPFTCQLSSSGYSYLLSGILPSKNREFFIQFANYICHVQATESIGKCSEACGLNALVEYSQLCSAIQEALLALIMHEKAWRNNWPGLCFCLLCWLHACCHEPQSLPSLGSVWKGKLESKAWKIVHVVEWTLFPIKNTQKGIVRLWPRICLNYIETFL